MSPKEVAQEFESLFLAQLLSIMQESVESSGLFEGGPGKEIYTAMMNQEMGRALAAGGGVGLSKLIEPYMSKQNGLKGHSDEFHAPPSSARPEEDSRNENQTLGLTVSSKLGWRKDPFTGETRYHRGVDFAVPHGTKVRSLTSGRVLFSGRQGGYGNTVVVESRSGVKTRYAHLSELGVTKGEEVSRGQEIGKVGDSGRATGPHLHLEMERSGKLLNPLKMGMRL
jgi:murein DD-endopeptidase MepM/ murein hydrolase activator NlpD